MFCIFFISNWAKIVQNKTKFLSDKFSAPTFYIVVVPPQFLAKFKFGNDN